MRRLLIALAALLCLASCSRKADNVPVYVWYSWHPEKVSADSLRDEFEMWKQHGVVGVCLENGSLSDSMTIERIKESSKIAHEAGLEFHAWVPSIIQNGCDSTWYTVNRLGRSAYVPEDRAYVTYYSTLDPHNPQVVDFLVSKYSEIASVPDVDYVQLDYIRYADVILAEGLWDKYKGVIDHEWRDSSGNVREYPGADYCYCDSCAADFKAQTGIDIKDYVNGGGDPSSVAEWAQFRCDNVTSLVNKIAEAVHAKGKKLSADVFPGPASYAEKMVRQQWNKWNVDKFFPMNYNDFYLQPASWVGTITAEETASTDAPVESGLFICHDWQNKANLVDPENSGLLPSEIAEAVTGAMAAGADGICLFTTDSMTEEHWNELDKVVLNKK